MVFIYKKDCKLNICVHYVQWRWKLENNLFPKFRGHCLVLFEVILTAVKTQFFKHIYLVKYILKRSIKTEMRHFLLPPRLLLVLIWHLLLILLIMCQTLFNWQSILPVFTDWLCKMVSCSKVTETLQQQVVQMKANSSQRKRSWSFQICYFQNIASLQCH